MLKPFLKISTIVLLVSFCYVSMNSIGQTNAFFSDQATITNTLTAGVLDMTLRSGQSNFVPGADDMEPGGQVNRDIYVGKTAISLALKHKVSFEYTGGNQDFCNQLDLKIWYDHYLGPVSGGYANRDMRLTYNGKLSNLANYTHIDFEIPHPDDQFDDNPNDGTEQWFYYSIILPSGTDIAYQDQTCNFDFVFEAWQINFPDSTQGFTDTEQISNSITSGHWETPAPKENMADHLVISEVQTAGGTDDDEFIELYNPTGSPVDISSWSIQYRGGGAATYQKKNFESDNTIPAHGFFLIAHGGSYDGTATYDMSWSQSLSATGGTVFLVNNQTELTEGTDGGSTVVDKVAYGAGGYLRPEGTAFTPAPAANQSIERKAQASSTPDTMKVGGLDEFKGNGYDTNNNSNDFILRDTPEPQNSSSPIEIDCPEVVLNEFLPNADQFPEYIELYNKGDESQDVNGWKIKLSNDTEIIISSDILYGNATSTIIGAEGSNTEWLAIDLSKIGPDILDDTSDTIYLYNENEDKKDGISYPLLESDSNPKPTPGEENETGENVSPPDKSFARFPDGIGDWIDPYPTPGGPNKLEEEPEIIDDQQDTTPLPQDSPEEPQITEDNPDETADEEAEAIKEDEKSGEGTTEGETGKEDSDTENEGDPTAETEEEPAAEESDDEIPPTEEPTDQAEEETPADEEPSVDETVVEEEPSIMPEETIIADGDVGVESDGDDGDGDSDDTGDDGDGNGEAGEAGTE